MRAASRMVVAGLVATLAGCSLASPTPAPVVIAPIPKTYTCSDQQQAGAEFRALPAGAVLRRLVVDYGALRAELRAVHGLPEPAACPPP